MPPDPGSLHASPPPVPLDAEGRIHALDILRGLALFGMILVHFHQRTRLDVAGLEGVIPWAVWVLVEQKSWGTFAFLFGAGFAVLLRRLESRGDPVVPIYLRRLIGLAAFGVIAQVGFGFTILFAYAVWGLVLLLVRRLPSRALLGLAVISACTVPILAELSALGLLGPGVTDHSGRDALAAAVELATRQSSYLVLLSARWALFAHELGDWHTWLPDTNLALFLLGLLAVRHRLIDEPRAHAGVIARWMALGFTAWAASWLLPGMLAGTGPAEVTWPLAMGFGLLRDQWLSLTYIGAVLLLLAYWPVWASRLRGIGLAGRMALTNYVGQAMTLDVISSGYGLGLRLRPALYAVAAVILFAAETRLSSAWLARYRWGPLEWAWRTLTYARPQPLRRNPTGSPTAAIP